MGKDSQDAAGRTQCVGAILIQGGTLLLGRRASHLRSYPDCWDIVGGHVEAGETFEQTLVREVKEEIGVTPVDFAQLTSLQFADGRMSCLGTSYDRCRTAPC